MKAANKNQQDIYQAIFDVVRLIPKGRVSSYGAIAAAIGMKSGARLVGYALRFCADVTPSVPAHRVVNSSGVLTGKFHFTPPEKMELLLNEEGVSVNNNKVVGFRELLWEPKNEL